MTDILILLSLFGLLVFFMWKLFMSRNTSSSEGQNPKQTISANITVPQNSIVKIRHASDGVEVEVSPVAPFDGPLSDAAEDAELWERLQSGNITSDERHRIAVILREHGFDIELEDEPLPEAERAESHEESAQSSVSTPPPEEVNAPVVEPASEKLSQYDLEDLQDLIVRGLRERLCTPAFALLASQEYGFSLEFEDGLMKERASDKSELALAEGYRDAIRKDLAEAMRLYSEDHPEPPEPEHEPIQPVLNLPSYDFGKMR